MEQNTSESLFGLKVDHESGSYFREATKWARFIAIVYFTGMVIILLAFALAGDVIIERIEEAYETTGQANLVEGIAGALISILVVGALIGLVWVILLYRFASLTRKGIERMNPDRFNEGLKSLKFYFMLTGILSVLGLLYTLFTTIAGAFGAQ